jgi:hypothetical protein
MNALCWRGALTWLGVATVSCGLRGEGALRPLGRGSAHPHQADAALPTAKQRDGTSSGHDGEDHRFCGWLHEFREDPASTERGYDTFAEHAEEFDAVHPKWWRVASPITFENHPRGRKTPFVGFDDPRVLMHTTRRGKRTKLIPLIAAVEQPDIGHVHTMIHDPELRRHHIEGIVALVMENGYDGVDIDYEHLSSALGPCETMQSEKAAFSTFIRDLAGALHTIEKTLSLAVPVPDTLISEFDYEALSRAADQIHVMAYDFHWAGGPHAGPVAPLAWVRRAVAHIGALGHPERTSKFILGLPNYGLFGKEAPPSNGAVKSCEPLAKCLELAGGSYQTMTDHMTHCSLDGRKIFDAGRAPKRILPNGDHLFFDDLASLEERVVVAQQAGLGGITSSSIGGEPEGPKGRTFFQMVRSHFPRH